MTLTLIQGIIFIFYIGYIIIRLKQIPVSISESWYLLNKNERNLFTLFCWSIGVLMLFQTDGATPFFFFSGAGFCFVGAATMFKEEMTAKIHFAGAFIGILSAFNGIYFERANWYPLILFSLFTALILLLKLKNSIFWIEIAAFIFILIGLL